MSALTHLAKEKALELGADFVGIASPDRFDSAPPNANPARIMPDYRAVVSFGIALSHGCLQAWFAKRSRRPQDDFDHRATTMLDDISFGLTRQFEREGFASCYIKQNESYNYYNGFKPDFSHKHAAMAAGLGVLGTSSLFVHSTFGAAVHLGSMITEAPLDPNPLIDAEKEHPCEGCNYCLQICPVQAIRADEKESFVMAGKKHSHQKHDMLRCLIGCDGFDGHEYQIGKKTVGTWSYNSREVTYPDGAMELIGLTEQELRHPMELAEGIVDPHLQYCGNCQKVCVGDRKRKDELFKLHIQSGLVDIPDDPTMIAHLEDANNELVPYDIEATGYDLENVDFKWVKD
jgi:epoxyqueuosine reductase QueG